jgi:hypothetical protein
MAPPAGNVWFTFISALLLPIKIDPWHLLVYGSKETTDKEELHLFRMHGVQHCTPDA